MTKYTINKVFERTFENPIWKIEVDYSKNNLAIECRNPKDTFPTFTVCSFEGDLLLEGYSVDVKEWTLAVIQGDYLILKKFGATSPIQAGIKIIHIPSQKDVVTYAEYILQEVNNNTIVARHRSISSGLFFYIDIATGHVSTTNKEQYAYRDIIIEYPSVYQGKLPTFMQDISYEDHIWIQVCPSYFIWSYLQKTGDSYEQHLILSSKNQVFKHIIVLSGLSKLILQPYFKVKDYIFFLSDTKQEIVTYLV